MVWIIVSFRLNQLGEIIYAMFWNLSYRLPLSICSYHRNGDEGNIRLWLEGCGYQTSVSRGYMLFLSSNDTWELGDLRRGVVYGKR